MRFLVALVTAMILAVGSMVAAAPAGAPAVAAEPRSSPPAAPPGTPPAKSPDRQPSARKATAPPTAAVLPARKLRTIDEAVKAGVVDPTVVEALREDGEAAATVAFDSTAILADAEIKAPPGKGHVKAKIAIADKGLADQRARVLKRAGAGVSVVQEYSHLDVVDVTITSARALLRLANDGEVVGITAPRELPTTLAESLPIIGQPTVKSQGYQGQGTYVAVLDTGADYPTYPSYFPGGSVAYEVDCNEQGCGAGASDGSRDDHSHGTHVSSTVLAVAPQTKILAYDVFRKNYWSNCPVETPYCNLTPTAAQQHAINDVIAKKGAGWNIVAVNMSLGGGWSDTACVDDRSFGVLRSYGILPVVAAANSFLVKNTLGQWVAQTGIGAPACIPAAISVGSTTDGRLQTVSYFSQTTTGSEATYGALLDVYAPGQEIIAATGPNSGTSMAAPHVAGAVAVLRGSWAFASNATGAMQIENLLETTGYPITDNRTGAPVITRPRLDLGAAVRSLDGTTDATPPTITGPTATMVADTQVTTANQVEVELRWGAKDTSGISKYELWVRQDGGTWTKDPNLPSLATSKRYLLTAGTKWEFLVRAFDGRSNYADRAGPPVRLGIFSQNQSATYTGTWTDALVADALGGTLTYSSAYGATGTFTFTNTAQIAWVGTRASNRGWAYTYLDGRGIGWTNSYASTTRRRVLLAIQNVTGYTATHTYKVWVYGAYGGTGSIVDVDGFILLQNQ